MSCKLVKRTLSQVFTIKKFSRESPLRAPIVASNREKVADSPRALKALIANPANEFTQ
jgi:hypothetical protein